MEEKNGKDDGEAIVEDPPPVPGPPSGDRFPSHHPAPDSPSMAPPPPPPAVFHDHSASLPVILETEGDGEDDSEAVAKGSLPVPAPQVGNYLAGADRPSLPPAALHDHSGTIPMTLDDHAIPNGCNGTAGSLSRHSSAGHRRTRSEVVFRGPKRPNSFQNLKSQIQRAMKWGGSPQEEHRDFSFDPEVLANQKRQWYQLQSKSLDRTKYKEPTELFEHLIVTGLPPQANLEAVEQAFARKKKWEIAMSRTVLIDRKHDYWFPSPPSLEPQMLFKYPPGKSLPMGSKDLCAFCFPGGVKSGEMEERDVRFHEEDMPCLRVWLQARMVERTPSLSDLNELVYGQGHLGRDDTAFIFSLKVADNASLYGVCLLVPEIVQRSPGILGGSSPFCRPAASRFLISAPRCYCLLTRVPFFELHFEMLNSIVSQERLNRITQFVNEVSITDRIPSPIRPPDHFNEATDPPVRDHFTEWMSSAIPVDSAVLLSASAAGIITDDEVTSSSVKSEETQSLPNANASEASFGRAKETNSGFGWSSSPVSLFSSSERNLEEEDDAYFSTNEENRNDFIKIVCGYKDLPVPARGIEIVFHPLEHLHTIQYRRPAVSNLGLEVDLLELEFQDPSALAEVSAKLAVAEETAALSIWTIATICRAISLDNILALVAGVLLEKQVVVTCPNLGVLSAIVLSLIPIIQPFEWHSLLLPILPEKLLDFLDAPVPFLVGIQQKPVDFVLKTNNLVYIDVFKDQRKMCDLPLLPEHNLLFERLRLVHARLVCEKSIAQRQHVYKFSESQAEAAMEFKEVMRHYMDSLCAEMRLNTITSVQSNNDRVSILLKDSFIDSFPAMDQPFMKLFIETQMFSVLSDSRLSSFEHE